MAFSSTRWVCSHSSQSSSPALRRHVVLDIVGDRLAAVALFERLDLKPHRDRLPRLKADVDDLDLACAARSGRLLQGLIDHRARGVGVMGAEHLDGLVMLDQLVDQVTRRAGREALRRHHRAVVPLQPAVLLQRLLRALLLDVEELVEGPDRPHVLLDHQRAERDSLVAVRMGDRTARLAVHQFDLAVLFLVGVEDGLPVAELEFLAGLRRTMGRRR